MSLSTDADVAAAEGDLAALRVHADRLADGFVKRRLARHLETVADEVAAARGARRGGRRRRAHVRGGGGRADRGAAGPGGRRGRRGPALAG